jgi:hypothetical protein
MTLLSDLQQLKLMQDARCGRLAYLACLCAADGLERAQALLTQMDSDDVDFLRELLCSCPITPRIGIPDTSPLPSDPTDDLTPSDPTAPPPPVNVCFSTIMGAACRLRGVALSAIAFLELFDELDDDMLAFVAALKLFAQLCDTSDAEGEANSVEAQQAMDAACNLFRTAAQAREKAKEQGGFFSDVFTELLAHLFNPLTGVIDLCCNFAPDINVASLVGAD